MVFSAGVFILLRQRKRVVWRHDLWHPVGMFSFDFPLITWRLSGVFWAAAF
jgi:hypothetical protein